MLTVSRTSASAQDKKALPPPKVAKPADSDSDDDSDDDEEQMQVVAKPKAAAAAPAAAAKPAAKAPAAAAKPAAKPAAKDDVSSCAGRAGPRAGAHDARTRAESAVRACLRMRVAWEGGLGAEEGLPQATTLSLCPVWCDRLPSPDPPSPRLL